MIAIVAYDIADPKRLNHIAKFMKDYGVRVQKSIFELSFPSERTLAVLIKRIKREINPAEDSVKIFPLCGECDVRNDIIGVGQYVDFSKDYVVI